MDLKYILSQLISLKESQRVQAAENVEALDAAIDLIRNSEQYKKEAGHDHDTRHCPEHGSCGDCKFRVLKDFEVPCSKCSNCKNTSTCYFTSEIDSIPKHDVEIDSIPKHDVEKHDVEKYEEPRCGNCEFVELDGSAEPCNKCSNASGSNTDKCYFTPKIKETENK